MDATFLKTRIFTIIEQCQKNNKPQFLGFLSEEERRFAESVIPNSCSYIFFGGYEGADRSVLGVFPCGINANEKAFQITPLTLFFRHQDKPTHRDFLGAVLALGIRREAVGDILIGEGFAVIFSSPDVAKLILAELKTVGRVGVRIENGISAELPQKSERVDASFTVSSLRVDCVVAAICSCSRNGAADLIKEGRVSINSVVCEKATKILLEGDKITVRGSGKYTLKQINGETKKGRLKITIEKYN